MKKVLILASGNGSNAENISKFLNKTDSENEIKVLCNVKNAGVFKKMTNLKIPCILIEIGNNMYLIKECQNFKPDLIILAGYLKKIPTELIEIFKKKIINIHPSLLPKFKGLNTFSRMLKNKERKAGCTVHYVNEKLDSGSKIIQKSFFVNTKDDELILRKKTQNLEHKAFPEAIIKIFRNF